MRSFARRAGLLFFMLSALLLNGSACTTSRHSTSSGAPLDRDVFVGWFTAPDCDHRCRELVPGEERLLYVRKDHGAYYTFDGIGEMELSKCPGGLELPPMGDYDRVTEFALDPASGQPYVILKGKRTASPDGHPVTGLKMPLTPTAKPSWAVDPAPSPSPRSNDDFVGFYRTPWCLWQDVVFQIRKENGVFLLVMTQTNDSGHWESQGSPNKLEPLSKGLGLAQEEDDGKSGVYFVYSKTKERYEYVMKMEDMSSSVALERIPAMPPAPRAALGEKTLEGIAMYK